MNHIMNPDAVATLLLVNHAIYDLITERILDADILEELDELQPRLQAVLDGLKEESPLHCHPTKSAV